MAFLISFISFVVVIYLIFVIVGWSLSAPSYHGPVSDHFDGKKFFNPEGIKAKGLKDVLTWMFNRKRGPWAVSQDSSSTYRPERSLSTGVRVTFINHTTFLLQVDGLNIVTDPVWSERASPFTWAGPKRMRPPGVNLEDLPKIDVILLSHNHYDHLDLPTVKKIFQRDRPKIITPLGVTAFLRKKGITSSNDVDWWESIRLDDNLAITAVPAQHFAGRGMFDRDATLWCGYVIQRKTGNIYFAGDTGYNDKTFKKIRERLGPFSISILPIGAYKPSWFMSPIHTSPEEAVKIHLDVRSTVSIASHFGTFPLADDGQRDPVNDLQQALQKRQLSKSDFIALKEGTFYETT